MLGNHVFRPTVRPDREIEYARLLADSGRFEAAARIVRTRLRRHPRDATAKILLARALAGGGDIAEATRVLASVPPDSTRKATALLHEGQARLRLDDTVQAEEVLRLCIRHPFATADERRQACRELAGLLATQDRQSDP